MPFGIITPALTLRMIKTADKKPVQMVIISGPNKTSTKNDVALTKSNGKVIPRSTNNRTVKESQTKELDRAGNFELKDVAPKVVQRVAPKKVEPLKQEVNQEPKPEPVKQEVKPEPKLVKQEPKIEPVKEDLKLDFMLTRTEEPKKEEVINKRAVPINKPNQQPKKEEQPNDGMGRLNMSDFF